MGRVKNVPGDGGFLTHNCTEVGTPQNRGGSSPRLKEGNLERGRQKENEK